MNIAVIMAGGIGARFWPLSRRNKPKQLLQIFGDKTLIHETADRLAPMFSPGNIKVVTVEDQIDLMLKHLPGFTRNDFISEPYGRNTAACIGLAAVHVAKQDPQAVMAILPADHRVELEQEFRDILEKGMERARQGDALITIGIKPTRPETGYGYIQMQTRRPESPGIFKVKTFAEKPDRKLAEAFVKSNEFLWNAGIFIARCDTLLEEFRRHLPDFYHDLEQYAKHIGSKDEQNQRKLLYDLIKPLSFDYGVMEHAKNVLVIPADIGWSDVGNWTEVKRLQPHDRENNAVVGEGLLVGSQNCYIHSHGHLTAVVGLENVVVVHTEDATLVCHLDKVQDVREAVAALEREKKTKLL